MGEISEVFSDLTLWMPFEDFIGKLLNRATRFLSSDAAAVAMMGKGETMKFVSWKGLDDEIGSITFEPNRIPSRGYVFTKDIKKAVERIFGEGAGDVIWKSGMSRLNKLMIGPLSSDKKVEGLILFGYSGDERITRKMRNDFRMFRRYVSMFVALKISQERERMYQSGVITAMTNLLEMRDPYTLGHSSRVARISARLASFMKLDREIVDRIYWAGVIHDIGKMGIPESILLKAGKLTPEEFEVVKMHPSLSEEAIENFPWLSSLRKIVRHHHEKWDGTGYPDGLSREDIPVESRIITVVDAFDAMTSDRAYRKALDVKTAKEELLSGASSQFDPYIVRMFLKFLKEIK